MPGFMIGGEGKGKPNTLETERVHRWKVVTLGEDGEQEWIDLAQNCTRPTLIIDKVTYHHQQNEIYVPGKHRWEPVRITFYAILEKTFAGLKKWRDKVVEAETTVDNLMWENEYKKDIQIESLDGKGETAIKYFLHGAWPERIEPSRWDHTDYGIATVEVTIAYDYAEEE
ncbi:MAG: phage tail protein [Candidatus Nanopelagicaceae bacterium]|nr:phage tail protein [Candidatus Nanopelagicaceae bacterium]